MHILARAELVDDPIASDLMRRVLRREHGAIVKVAGLHRLQQRA